MFYGSDEAGGQRLAETDRGADHKIRLFLIQDLRPLGDSTAMQSNCPPKFGAAAAENVDGLLLGEIHGFSPSVECTRQMICQA